MALFFFCAPLKHQETSGSLVYFWEYRMRLVPWNGLKILLTNMSVECWYSWLFHMVSNLSRTLIDCFFFVTPYLVVAVQPCMKWIPIKKRKRKVFLIIFILLLLYNGISRFTAPSPLSTQRWHQIWNLICKNISFKTKNKSNTSSS